MILTDFHPKVLETLQCNVQMNAADIQVSPLDWVEFGEGGSSSNNKIIEAADVILESGIIFKIVLYNLARSYKFTFYRCCV